MSIHPVPMLGTAADPIANDPRLREAARMPSRPTSEPDSGKKSRVENRRLEPSMDSPPMRQDEVQVQRVNGASGDIVIRYLDASGNLILQIPSSQLLGLAKAVDQALAEQAHRRANGSEQVQPGQGELSDGR